MYQKSHCSIELHWVLRKIQNSSKEGGAPLRTAVTDRGTQTNFTKPLVITVRGGGERREREGGRPSWRTLPQIHLCGAY